MSDKIILGITGLGGYAGQMLDWLLETDGAASGVQIGAICEPQVELFPTTAAELARRGIPIRTSYADFLAEKLDAVYLPLPIHLHRQYTEQALGARKPVLCEKPAAGCIDDVDAMIAARDRARLPAAIAFQHVYQPSVRRAKQRLLAGEFGAVRRASVMGCWPRNEEYFRRNDWAGKISLHGQMVSDSPANNAMAHYIHLCLFLLDSRPRTVEAELYRANSIENYDTCSLRVTLEDGIQMLVGLTHASARQVDVEIVIHTDRGELRCVAGDRIEFHANNRSETMLLEKPLQAAMFRGFAEYVRSGNDDGVGTLEMARRHSAVIGAASQSPIVDVPANRVGGVQAIAGIEEILRQSVEAGHMLYESRLTPWARPATSADVR
jgi:predicted dehydrogenase